MNDNNKNILLNLAVVLFFIIISYAYFTPQIEGKKLTGHDVKTYLGMSQEKRTFQERTGVDPLWTNSMFGGMPTFLISGAASPNLIRKIHAFLNFIGRPASFLFIYLLGAFIAFRLFHLKLLPSLLGALAYAFSSYFLIIIQAGHNSKALALGYMPPIIAGMFAAYNGKRILGSLVFGLFLALQIVVNHLQITYYTLLLTIIFIIFQFIYSIQKKAFKQFLITSLVLLVLALLALGSNATTFLTTIEYGKYSMRGKTELTFDKDIQTSGLDKDYATDWSYGNWETFTLLIPNFHGGGSADGELGINSATYRLFEKSQGTAYAKKVIKQMPLYWGSQPSTSGPVYVGAVVVFLFVLGLFILKGPVKWWLIIATGFSILLAWGRNLPWLTNFFLDYFPGYNKFRTVAMTLVIAEFTMPLLGFLALKEIVEAKIKEKDLIKYVKNSLYIVGGICLFFVLMPGLFFNFSAESDNYYLSQGASQFVDALLEDRRHMLSSDAFRSLVFVVLSSGVIFMFARKKIKVHVVFLLLGLLLLIDMWPVDKRYLNNADFVPSKELQNPFTSTQADEIILADKDPDYRVLNLSVNTFNDANTSYFHKSIGGYHGAKMKRYQELIEYSISKDIQNLASTFNRQPTQNTIDSTLARLYALNMLNTRYIIYHPDAAPLRNNHALGNAWFVKDYKMVKNADEELLSMNNTNPASTALIDERYKAMVKDFRIIPDSMAQIALVEYQPNYLKYQSNADQKQMAVFSEIFYEKGWNAFIDNQPVPHFSTDYVLRAMIVPEGNHIIEFKFQPTSYYIGNKIALPSSSVLLLLVLLGIGYEVYTTFKNRKKADIE